MTISIVNKEDFILAMKSLREGNVEFIAAGSMAKLNGRPAIEIVEDDDDILGIAHQQMYAISKLEKAGIKYSVHEETIDELEADAIS